MKVLFIHCDDTRSQSCSADSGFAELETILLITKPVPQNTENLTEEGDSIAEKTGNIVLEEVLLEEDNSAPEKDSGLIEKYQPEEVPSTEAPAA